MRYWLEFDTLHGLYYQGPFPNLPKAKKQAEKVGRQGYAWVINESLMVLVGNLHSITVRPLADKEHP